MTETPAPETERKLQNASSQVSRKLPDMVPETARAQPDTAHAHHVLSRTTLQPSVQDFSGKIINRTLVETNEDQMLWTVGGKIPLRLPISKEEHTYQPPIPATFRWARSVSPLHLESARLPLVRSVINSGRVAIWTEDVHRHHVARTAHARAHLTPKTLVKEGAVPSSAQTAFVETFQRSFSLTVAALNETGVMDDADLQDPPKTSPRKENTVTSRARPATTGRYFDKGNGLWNTKSIVLMRSRHRTANHLIWTSPGLSIKKVVLHPKECV